MNWTLKSLLRRQWAPPALCGFALFAGVAGAAPLPPLGPVWTQQYDQPNKRNIAYDLVVDAAGSSYSVYRTGEDRSAVVNVAKYNTSGQRLWVSALSVVGSVDQDIWAQADADGNLVVAGTLTNEQRSRDIAVGKFSDSGELLWSRVYNGAANSFDKVGDVAVDSTGDIYIAGDTTNPQDTSLDALLLKLSREDGSTLWQATLPGDAGTSQNGYDVVVDDSGGVYLAGSGRKELNRSVMLTAKFDAGNGAPIWTSTYSAIGDIAGYALSIGLSGSGVIVAGSSRGSESYDFVTIRYNAADGQQQWVSRYDGPETGLFSTDEPSALTIDTNGNPIVTGVSRASGATVADYATVKYDGTTGAQLWVARYDGPGAENATNFTVDFPYDVRADAAGNVYVTGDVVVARSRYDMATIKYNSAGQQQWVHLYNRGLDDYPGGLGIDGAGNVYVNGTATLRDNSEGTSDTTVVLLKYLPTGRSGVVTGPPPPRPTFTFSESAKDKLVCTRAAGQATCSEATTTTFKVTSTATMQDVDLTAFNAATPFTLSVGGLELARTLGDDPRYTPGKTKATLVTNILDADNRTRKALTVTLSWPKGKLRVSVVSTAYFAEDLLAADFLDQPTSTLTDETEATVSLGSFSQKFAVAAKGKVTTRPTRDGEFSLSTVTLTGKGTGI